MARLLDLARLVDLDAVTGLVRSLGRSPATISPPDQPDQQLVAHVQKPFESIEDTQTRLSALEAQLRRQSDRRAVFLSIYVQMTREVARGLRADRFDEAQWMHDYVVTFANYYRRAFLAFEEGRLDAVPMPWQIAFDTALDADALVIQDAFLGVNAHINYDLALALDTLGIDPNRDAKYDDHREINDILATIVDAQQRMLAEEYAAGVDDLDAAFGELDETLTLRSMTEGREQAWRIAVVLTDFEWSPAVSFARWILRTTATAGAHAIANPALDPSTLDALREIEQDGFDLAATLDSERRTQYAEP